MIAEWLGTSRQETLTLLLRHGESSAAELAEVRGISVQAMRRHLRSLEQDGLVKAISISEGPGRPSNLWQLTTQGQKSFHNGSENFALDLLASIQAKIPPDKVADLFSDQMLQKASLYRNQIGKGSLKQRLEKLVQLRNEEGFLSEYHLTSDGLSWFLSEYTCSISGIAEKYPFVCDQELEMIRQTFPDCEVQRVLWRLESGHSCGFQLTPKKDE